MVTMTPNEGEAFNFLFLRDIQAIKCHWKPTVMGLERSEDGIIVREGQAFHLFVPVGNRDLTL